MNMNDERYLYCPDLPQYGNQLTCCEARLPQSGGLLLDAGLGFLGLMFVSLCVQLGMKTFPENVALQTAIAITGLVVAIIGWYAARTALFGQRKDALFVFEGGVHLNESVAYWVPNGQLMAFHTGTRQVSLPWRVLQNLNLCDQRENDEDHVEASFRLPDGRTMKINTSDGAESAIAIQTIAKKLGA